MTPDFAYLIKKYGKPAGTIVPAQVRLEALRGRLPDSLLEFWSEVGIGTWLDGLFQFCDPSTLSSIVDAIFDKDPMFAPQDVAGYGFTAFSRLFCWHRTAGRLKVDLVFCAVSSNVPKSDDEKAVQAGLGADRLIATNIMNLTRSEDMIDVAGAKLFGRARDTLGVLESGECYGFFPAIKLGGAVELKGLRRVRALEHFSILSGLDSFTCYNVEDGVEQPGRRIGPG